jgi:hypothetical protein
VGVGVGLGTGTGDGLVAVVVVPPLPPHAAAAAARMTNASGASRTREGWLMPPHRACLRPISTVSRLRRPTFGHLPASATVATLLRHFSRFTLLENAPSEGVGTSYSRYTFDRPLTTFWGCRNPIPQSESGWTRPPCHLAGGFAWPGSRNCWL